MFSDDQKQLLSDALQYVDEWSKRSFASKTDGNELPPDALETAAQQLNQYLGQIEELASTLDGSGT